MPRKALSADAERCRVESFPNICDILDGDDAGTFMFSYLSESLPLGFVNIQVMVPDTDEYPKNHRYFLFVEHDQEVPAAVPRALSDLTDSLGGKPFSQMLQAVSAAVHRSLNPQKGANHVLPEDGVGDEEADSSDEELALGGESEYEDFEISDLSDEDEEPKHPGSGHTQSDTGTYLLRRARADLRIAKEAGFRVGRLGDINSGGIACISIRVTKLGISEEAMQAWGLHRKHYLVLMIRYCDGYKTLEQVSELPNLSGRTAVHVSLCKHYKPKLADAVITFTPATDASHLSRHTTGGQSNVSIDAGITTGISTDLLETLFIGQPLNDLLRSRFPTILKYRIACGFEWSGAEQFFNDNQGKSLTSENPIHSKYYATGDDSGPDRALPQIVNADAISDTLLTGGKHSFPLVAMQFLLRHFVRCTEFCLVCHCRVEGTFEALKPYVCSKPLCLYQYMSLGFGPSIEWEILSQPYVVDLLVSFCYVSAHEGRLKDFPVGIGLHVPALPDFVELNRPPSSHHRSHQPTLPSVKGSQSTEKSFTAVYHPECKEIIVQGLTICPVKAGDWLVMLSKSIEGRQHCRITEVTYFPTLKIGQTVTAVRSTTDYAGTYDRYGTASRQPVNTPAQSPKEPPKGSFEVQCFLYDKLFDEMSNDFKRQAITSLLDTLPDIYTMRNYLEMQSRRDPSLRNCQNVSESALNLLRWIIASNRSCILQVDKTLDKHIGGSGTSTPTIRTPSIGGKEDRVSGMEGWMQFRFAQGAPDKEQRFIDCVNQEMAKTTTKFPTIFAWHGSPLRNWHSIIREGLHFKEALHGRAYGDGVYMSPHASTSLSYSQMYGGYGGSGYAGSGTWPNSVLGISNALSLNEVVNSLRDFKSRSPHYVVEQIQWIQTRYLFVKASKATEITASDSGPPRVVYTQDPTAPVVGEKGTPIAVPITAVSKSRRPATSPGSNQVGSKKAKSLKETNQQTAESLEDAANSEVSATSDIEFLESDEEPIEGEDSDDGSMDWAPDYQLDRPSGAKRSSDEFLTNSPDPIASSKSKMAELKIRSDPSRTDFFPGTLDLSKFKMLKKPSNASTITTRQLMNTLKVLSKVQQSTPLHELGWYVDFESIDNVYQWIVELHSFDATLPLAGDMKKAKLSSVVLEFRFTNSFPFAPPFVRVVSPRFLPFNQGGGGHVTLGGAICMELLTNDGWLATNSIESVLLQIRLALSSVDPKPARLQMGGGGAGASYGVGEAIEAYKRACAMHGWTVPADFDTLQKD